MKKHNSDVCDLVYIYLNENNQYILSHGIEFFEFAQTVPNPLGNILLLKHQFDDGDFNMHTLLEYVPSERIEKLIKDDVYDYGDFCWLDFEEEDGLNELTQQEIAELLYLGHLKQHLHTPFYSQLGNQYVYLAHDDGWFNKTYYRHLEDFYWMLGRLIPSKVGKLKFEKSLFRIGKKRSYPTIQQDTLLSLRDMIKEGTVISLKKALQNRNRIEIPMWVIGDFANMDDMYEVYEQESNHECDAKLVFDRKSKEWRIYSK
ncbi:hypothetical protein H1Z61_06835 [Bacillus aquiflavi]|uniref:Oxalate:formate antiporter n=1 Tax=Bacillus aquiflavi TaxID=2672567 RepID=A0A6B3VTB7_9BACI|nr:hypothetical protein [Bacillus aquiflavi]MBA4536862.1 hypothetical protein [Bacillus aquiflavi]NEY81229.1 hypothetical protein [Bacillus aquiflavi]UAC48463.1 hypothetical protein K6959_00080 [Bacillus aquiflavi]